MTDVLANDPLPILVLSNESGVDVYSGRTDRTLAPAIFPSFPVPQATSLRLLAAKALPATPGMQLFALGGVAGASGIGQVIGESQMTVPMFVLPFLPDQLVPDPVVANFDDQVSPCQEIALGFLTETRVHVYPTCRLEAGTWVINALGATQRKFSDVTIPGAAIITGLETGDMNGDGHADLLINTPSHIFVAYGLGDGTFNSTSPPPTWNSGLQDNTASVFSYTIQGDSTSALVDFPLAIANLNQDGIVDFVLPKAVVLAQPMGAPYTLAALAPAAWTAARIASMNGTALPSIAAASGATVDYYAATGASGLLNHASYMATGTVGLPHIADVDGDGVNDSRLPRVGLGRDRRGRPHGDVRRGDRLPRAAHHPRPPPGDS